MTIIGALKFLISEASPDGSRIQNYSSRVLLSAPLGLVGRIQNVDSDAPRGR